MAHVQQSGQLGEDNTGASFRDRYRRSLAKMKGGLLEGSRAVEGPPAELLERVDEIRGDLLRVVDAVLQGDSEARGLVERLAKDGGAALALLANDDVKLVPGSKHAADLEAIVRADGSRPSFLIRNGVVDFDSSPVGTWQGALLHSAEHLPGPLACVGRIDLDGEHEGTGFLVAGDVICTNRHVLQNVAVRSGKQWQVRPNVSIDFGQEFRAQDSLDRREVLEVLYSGPDTVGDPVDYKKLDLVLLRVSPAAKAGKQVLSVDIAPDWPDGAVDVYVVGYAAKPAANYSPSLLEQLFKVTWGKKRLAPGSTIKPRATSEAWTFGHDATTLNGNSGSVVLVAGREHMAAGIHFGGRRGELAENWGHIFGLTLDAPDLTSGRTLRECFERVGVVLLDRLKSDGA